MKENWNHTKRGEYYLGLDIGTDSVGWAVTDTSAEYHLLRFRGNVMQGITLFDGAEDNKARRRNRTNRRRTARSAWRLLQLESLFTPEIVKVDPTFFIRLRNSFCCLRIRMKRYSRRTIRCFMIRTLRMWNTCRHTPPYITFDRNWSVPQSLMTSVWFIWRFITL